MQTVSLFKKETSKTDFIDIEISEITNYQFIKKLKIIKLYSDLINKDFTYPFIHIPQLRSQLLIEELKLQYKYRKLANTITKQEIKKLKDLVEQQLKLILYKNKNTYENTLYFFHIFDQIKTIYIKKPEKRALIITQQDFPQTILAIKLILQYSRELGLIKNSNELKTEKLIQIIQKLIYCKDKEKTIKEILKNILLEDQVISQYQNPFKVIVKEGVIKIELDPIRQMFNQECYLEEEYKENLEFLEEEKIYYIEKIQNILRRNKITTIEQITPEKIENLKNKIRDIADKKEIEQYIKNLKKIENKIKIEKSRGKE